MPAMGFCPQIQILLHNGKTQEPSYGYRTPNVAHHHTLVGKDGEAFYWDRPNSRNFQVSLHQYLCLVSMVTGPLMLHSIIHWLAERERYFAEIFQTSSTSRFHCNNISGIYSIKKLRNKPTDAGGIAPTEIYFSWTTELDTESQCFTISFHNMAIRPVSHSQNV